MSAANVAGYQANAKKSGTAASAVIFQCEDAIKAAKNYTTRGGADGDNWPGTAVRCAFAYKATGDAKYLTQAIKYWKASLDDDQTLGDAQGCTTSASPNWQSWNGNPPAPPIIRTITHDTGYPMRWYGPYIALTYDWLNDAPGSTPGCSRRRARASARGTTTTPRRAITATRPGRTTTPATSLRRR